MRLLTREAAIRLHNALKTAAMVVFTATFLMLVAATIMPRGESRDFMHIVAAVLPVAFLVISSLGILATFIEHGSLEHDDD